MNRDIINKTIELRQKLNSIAELSGEEIKTKKYLIDFISKNTTLHIDDYGQWFCAVHTEQDACETIAFRADMDALPFEGKAAHLCGHDGHSAVLAGLGLLLQNTSIGKNIVLIFQHGEETGIGGKVCSDAIKTYGIKRIYAFHNIPGYDEGTVLFCKGTFACASMGMTILFKGAPSHAAYPEYGRNCGYTAARFIYMLPELAQKAGANGLAMATLIGAKIGKKAFGSAAANAEIWLTLRAWRQDGLNALIQSIKQTAETEAATDRAAVEFSYCDAFPATVNDSSLLEGAKSICKKAGIKYSELPEPFRWSEDFGYYGEAAKALMVGIGAGKNHPQLHTSEYCFNDNIIPTALKLFYCLAEQGG